jgi:pyruvate/2-oxoacid:ferredoxin oxidoreductase alpha subunit
MKKVLTGNQAVAWGVMCARAQVVSAYPITPQTTIIEELAELVDKGMLQAEFIKVESEHSAMAGCIGATAAGARSFTATSAQGLALMHELLHWAALGRLPVVMADVNRAMAPGWSIWTDQNDSLAQRDTGWLQYYCESNQEVLDTIIQAYKIAETVSLPVMIVLDAFFLSHTSEAVHIPMQEATDPYLPPYTPEVKLDVDHPRAFGGMVGQDIYMEFRYKMQLAMDEALDVCASADREYGERFGRSYGLVEVYPDVNSDVNEFDLMLVTSGSVTSTARIAIDKLHAEGLNVGLLKIRLFRPFPAEAVASALGKTRKVAVLDRNICVGMGGIFAQEVKAALYNQPVYETARNGKLIHRSPEIVEYIAGLGGRDITPQTIEWVLNDALTREVGDKPVWVGLKE